MRTSSSSELMTTSHTRSATLLWSDGQSEQAPGQNSLEISEERAVTVKQDPELEQELVRQNSLGYGGLIAIGVVMVQPFLTAAPVDLSARICIVAFSVAIPLLAALVLVNRQEVFRRRRTKSVLVSVTQVVAQLCAFVGVAAGFWHILWIAGVGILAAGLAAVAVQSAGYTRVERDQKP